MEFVEVAAEPVEFCTLMVDKVAGKKDGVALLSIDEVNDGTSVTFMSIAKGADMKIGELGDAVTIKLFG